MNESTRYYPVPEHPNLVCWDIDTSGIAWITSKTAGRRISRLDSDDLRLMVKSGLAREEINRTAKPN